MSGDGLIDQNEAVASIVSLLLIGVLVAMIMGFSAREQFTYSPAAEVIEVVSKADAKTNPNEHAREYRDAEVEERFQQAVAMLHAKQFDYAVKALNRVLVLEPGMAEAHVNMGFAFYGLNEFKSARDSFNRAIDMKPYQANAYWGLAISSESLGEIDVALGAMRAFIHLSEPNDPFLRKARSALWEWESSLTRGTLPQEEQEWIERRSKEWVDRNGPEADSMGSHDTSQSATINVD